MNRPAAKPATARSLARYARAATVLSPIALDALHAAALAALVARTGESRSALVRRLLREAAGVSP